MLATLMVERDDITKAECVIGDHLKRTSREQKHLDLSVFFSASGSLFLFPAVSS